PRAVSRIARAIHADSASIICASMRRACSCAASAPISTRPSSEPPQRLACTASSMSASSRNVAFEPSLSSLDMSHSPTAKMLPNQNVELLVFSVSGVTRWLDQIDMPWLRSPAGAPVPVLAQPTSRYTVEGGVQVANCQRSTLPVKLPALAYNGGGTKS